MLAPDGDVAQLWQQHRRRRRGAAEQRRCRRREAPAVHRVPHVEQRVAAQRYDGLGALEEAARDPQDGRRVAEQHHARHQQLVVVSRRRPQAELASGGARHDGRALERRRDELRDLVARRRRPRRHRDQDAHQRRSRAFGSPERGGAVSARSQ
eukprot:4928628-Prymnesium_polylepis.1